MTAILERIKQPRYRCSTCHRSWSSKYSADAHIAAGCIKDVDAHGCATCEHDTRRHYAEDRCRVGVRPEGKTAIVHCPAWELGKWVEEFGV